MLIYEPPAHGTLCCITNPAVALSSCTSEAIKSEGIII